MLFIEKLGSQIRTSLSVFSLVVKVLSRIRQVQEIEVSHCSPVQKVKQLQSVRRQTSPLAITPTTNRRVEEISNRVLVIYY